MRKLVTLLVLLFAWPVLAQQSVIQSGNVTNKHIPYWISSGTIADGGSATDSPISTIGVTNNGGAGICVSSDRQSAAGRNQLCFGASTNSPAVISLQNYGTAPATTLQFVLNGAATTPLFITGTPLAGDLAIFQSAQTIADSGLAAAAGIITSGTWQGTAVALGFGGTGGNSATTARTNLGLGTMAVQNAASVAITGGSITGMSNPVVASDVATKSYVDATASGLNILAQSSLATATVLPNSPTYANGASGVGATLTAGSNTTLTVDGTVAALNVIVLVKNQAAPAQNGIYKVTTAGDGSNAWVLTRVTYFDQAAEMKAGSYTFITAGATNINTSYTLAATIVTVGTDALNWNLFSSIGSVVSSLNQQTGALVDFPFPQGRLTLTSNTPVLTSSVAAATTVYYTGYVGKNVPIYNGTAVAVYQLCVAGTSGACELSIALGSNWAAGTNYDVFAALDTGTLRICTGPAWSTSLVRGTGAGTTQLSVFDGLQTNTVQITCRYNNTTTITVAANQGTYLGTFLTGLAGQTNFIFGAPASGGTSGLFGVWNMYNQVITTSSVTDNGSFYTYSSATVRQARNSTGNQFQFVVGLGFSGLTGFYSAEAATIAAGASATFGLGLDSTTTYGCQPARVITPTGITAVRQMNTTTCPWNPGIGVHTLSANENSDSTNLNQFDNGTTNTLSISLSN